MKIKHFLLFLIIPISLYINFFIFNITPWNIYIKVWLIYSGLIIIGESLLLLLLDKLIKKLARKNLNDLEAYTNAIFLFFIIGNIFFIFPYKNLWYMVPSFQSLLVFVSSMLFWEKRSKRKKKLNLIAMFLTIDSKIKNRKQKIILTLKIILVLLITNTVLQIGILKIYDPHIMSMKCFEKEFNAKITTKYKTLPF